MLSAGLQLATLTLNRCIREPNHINSIRFPVPHVTVRLLNLVSLPLPSMDLISLASLKSAFNQLKYNVFKFYNLDSCRKNHFHTTFIIIVKSSPLIDLTIIRTRSSLYVQIIGLALEHGYCKTKSMRLRQFYFAIELIYPLLFRVVYRSKR